ncbi:MAG: DUF711 family protein [Crenarchaeota archaeon]|nr:DUF711 family protein [Thermoproteota archaeon]
MTLHIPIEPGDITEPAAFIRGAWTRLNEIKRRVEAAGFNVWSLRLSLSPSEELPDARVLRALGDASAGYGEDLLVAAVHAPYTTTNAERAVEAVLSAQNMYASLLVENVDETYMHVHRILRRLGPHASRLALLFGGFIQTPYFPAAACLSEEECFTVSLLYPRTISRLGSNGFNTVAREAGRLEEALRIISSDLGVKYCGIDASLSPWMSESVAEALESMSGLRLYEYGFIHTVRRANELIEETICSAVSCTGFNEVMLAVAEDDLLKRYAEEGTLTLDTLLHLVFGCVVGLDMVAIEEPSDELLRRIMLEVYTASRVKGRVTGLRLLYAPRGSKKLYIDETLGETPLVRYTMERLQRP